MDQQHKFIEQSLATANNYLSTDRPNEAIGLLSAVKNIDPDNEHFRYLQHYIISVMQGQKLYPSPFYGESWRGESLDDKSIEIFCDQGMGDTLQMLRYVHQIKKQWNCKVVLNCYAFYSALKDLMKDIEYVDEFVNYHIPCDYQTNIMSLAYHLNNVDVSFFYPAEFEIINNYIVSYSPIETFRILPLDPTDSLKIGIAWKSNSKNSQLSKDKSIPVELLRSLSECGELYSLIPAEEDVEFIHSYCFNTMSDTAALIDQMDIVVSVDTAVLHLAGSMNAKTYGLLHHNHDPRWNASWYDNVSLYKQEKDGEWDKPIEQIVEICNTLILKNT